MPISERVSERVARLGSGVFARNDQRKAAYAARCLQAPELGLPPLLDLSLGSTDLRPPESVLAAIAARLQHPTSASYCLHAGTRPFREAVATWARGRFGVTVDPETEVLLLVGSQEGTAHLPLAVLEPGDRAVLLDPGYPSHRGGLLLASAQLEPLQLQASAGWRPNFDAIPAARWAETRLMVLGFPHNPTATTGEQTWLDEAMALALRYGFVLAHDNPYVDLSLEGEAPALLRHRDWRACGIEFFSLSKGWCLGGYRLGFAIGAAWLIEALRQLKAVVDFNQSLALQAGACEALLQHPHWHEQLRTVYRQRRDRLAAALERVGWPAPAASMALYLWLPIPPQAQARGLDAEAFCAALLEATGVCLTPGNGFGAAGEGWQRLALVQPVAQLEAGAARIGAWLESL
ncbi:MAG: aminotransferase class I/II-fold pyridoxal phosphate-dependent enzyme [Cyanobium sp.]|jgi:aspartate/methionine/tyrosine aminotransferase|nr:aminotransferase class I/II-fold pyridoxal phosphate-dependent enzyme [Synechococcaceae cyanobacterium]